MPNIKSAKKRVLQAEAKRVINTARKSSIKTAIKKLHEALDARQFDKARELLVDVEAQLSRAKGKGVIHRNTAARKISRLTQHVNKSVKAAAETAL